MSKACLLFPGQGSQTIEMAAVNGFEEIFKIASDILGYDLTAVISDEAKLNDTHYTQPAIFTASYAWLKKLSVTREAAYLIGHSLGEWTAAVAAGCLSFEDGLKAVQSRGRLMANFSSGGAMAAVLGMNTDEVDKSIVTYEDLYIANYNLPEQTVVSGKKESLEKYIEDMDGKAKVILLKVSGPFHTPLMEEAKSNFEKETDSLQFKDASIPLILNQTAEAQTDGNVIKDSLIGQIAKPVRFYQSLEYVINNGAAKFYEIGPSKVLCGMVKKFDKSISVLSSKEIDLKATSVNNSIK